MKDAFIDIMVSMMPLMKPFMWIAVAVAVLGIVLVVSNLAFKTRLNKSIVWSGRIVLAASVFFLAAQFAGYVLNMPPTINFGDSNKFEFILVSFWQIGLAFLIAGLLIKFFGADKSQEVSQES